MSTKRKVERVSRFCKLRNTEVIIEQKVVILPGDDKNPADRKIAEANCLSRMECTRKDCECQGGTISPF